VSNEPASSIGDKSARFLFSAWFTSPTSQAPPTSIEDGIPFFVEGLVEGTVDFQAVDDKDPFALLLRGVVELTRLIRRAIKEIDARGDAHWPQHPEVLARTWTEFLGLHDQVRAHSAAIKRLVNAVRANAVTPELISNSDVLDAQKAFSRLVLARPLNSTILRALTASEHEHKTADQLLTECPSLLALRALPPDSFLHTNDQPPERKVLAWFSFHSIGIMADDMLKLADRIGEAAIAPLATRLDALSSQGPSQALGDGKLPEDTAELPDLVTLDQAAAVVHISKRTLERYKTGGALPDPIREGGGGKPALYDWKIMGPWLTKTFGINLPEKFPANLR
jgi:hypothetical protein